MRFCPPPLVFGLIVLAAVVRLGTLANRCEAAESRRPNIIFLLTDDQRWDTLGCMGNKIIQTRPVVANRVLVVGLPPCYAAISSCPPLYASRLACLTSATMIINRLAAAPCVAGLVLALGITNSMEAAMTLDEIIAPGTRPEVLGTGYGFCEGPAADAQGNVYFSDGKKDSIHFYQPGKPVALFVDDSTDANGMIFNGKGELCVCEGAAYRVVAFDVKTRQKRVLFPKNAASQIDGTHFNEPNDLAVDHRDGFYFTDPNYRHRGQETVMKEDTYYCSPQGKITRVSTVCVKPNGVLLTPDDKILYLADARGQRIYKYDVAGPGKLANETLWIDNLGANPDGMTLDQHANLYVCCGRAGVKVYTPKGKPIGVIEVPYASNCCFGGSDFSTLFITSSDKFLGIKTKVQGVKPPCLRRK